MNYGEGLQKKIKNNVHNRFMAAEGIELVNFVTTQENVNIYEEFNHRLIYLMKLIKLEILGASNEYPVEKVRKNIGNNVKAMQKLISSNDLDGVQSFK